METGTGYSQSDLCRIWNILNTGIEATLQPNTSPDVSNGRNQAISDREIRRHQLRKTALQVFSIFGYFRPLLQITDDPRAEMLTEAVTAAIRN